MSATRCYNAIKDRLPTSRSFRVSVAMMNGKYKYINCREPKQFKAWVKKHYHNIHTIVSVK